MLYKKIVFAVGVLKVIMERVKAVVAQQYDVDEDDITQDTTFDELGAEEEDIVEFLDALSDEFEIDIPPYIADTIENVGDVVKFIKKQVN